MILVDPIDDDFDRLRVAARIEEKRLEEIYMLLGELVVIYAYLEIAKIVSDIRLPQ